MLDNYNYGVAGDAIFKPLRITVNKRYNCKLGWQ